MTPLKRRTLLAVALAPALPVSAQVPAAAAEPLRRAIDAFVGTAPLRTGRVQIEIAPLVENGNAVPVELSVDSPMTEADHVRALALFTQRNPQPEVAVFHLGPHSGRARVATRMRLATSQQVVAVARLADGSCWQTAVDVLVTLAACVEE